MHPAGQIEHGHQQRTPRGKGWKRVGAEFGQLFDQGRCESKFASLQERRGVCVRRQIPRYFPGGSLRRGRRRRRGYLDLTERSDDQFSVRASNGDKGHGVAKIVAMGAQHVRARIDLQFVAQAALPGQFARLQSQHVMRKGNRAAVFVSGRMSQAVGHGVNSQWPQCG